MTFTIIIRQRMASCEDYFLKTHPYFKVVNDTESLYVKNGEMLFVNMHKKKFFEAFQKNRISILLTSKAGLWPL